MTQLGDLAWLEGDGQTAVEWCSQSREIADQDQLWQASLACQLPKTWGAMLSPVVEILAL